MIRKNDIAELAEALQHGDNQKHTDKILGRIFRNKKYTTIFCQLKALKPDMSKQDYNKAVLIVVLALIYRRPAGLNPLIRAIDEAGLTGSLYGGLNIYLGGKNPGFTLHVRWSDSSFPNKYEFITRFSGEFRLPETHGLLYAVQIIAYLNQKRFEELAFKDTTHFILLNLDRIDTSVSDELIMKLFTLGDDLQSNIGLDLASRGILDSIEIQEKFDFFYKNCSPERKTSLLINYILIQRKYPLQFGDWLMQHELKDHLISEIKNSGKIRTLHDLCTVSFLIHDFPCIDKNGVRRNKNAYYDAVTDQLKTFIGQRTGIYVRDANTDNIFRNICRNLPLRNKRKLIKYLKKQMDRYMVSELDQMTRFKIYLEDKRQWDICQGMLEILSGS